MASHSNILAWRIPWTEELGGLQSMRLQRVGYDRLTNTFTFFFLSVYLTYDIHPMRNAVIISDKAKIYSIVK